MDPKQMLRQSVKLGLLFVLSLAVAMPLVAEERAVPAIGAYHWPLGTAGVDAFAAWLDRPAVWALDFVGSESWDNVEWPTWWLDGWSKWVHAKPGRRLILAIPILPGPVDGSGPIEGKLDVKQPVSLAVGAAGRYNHHFEQLAKNLVDYKLTDVILRPGWEFNGSWYAWRAKGQPKAFAEYWRQIVNTIRGVPGTGQIKFCWNPTLGDQDFPADEAWPGDEFVDYVGIDVYDETWNADTYPWPAGTSDQEIEARQQKVWKEWIVYSPRGLAFWAKFARQHRKPLAFPEWGLNHRDDGHGGQDNPHFVEQMHAFITDPANHVAFHCYFDVNGSIGGNHQLSPGIAGSGHKEGTEFPRAAARFKALFSRTRLF
jgi:hypothetical protein